MIHSHATTKKHGKWLEKASRLLAIGSVLCVLIGCAPESQPSTDLSSTSQSLYEEQVVFATPEQAVDALVTATREDQRDDLLKILGPNAHQVIYSGDKVADI